MMDDDEALAFAREQNQEEIYHVGRREYKKVASKTDKHYVNVASEEDIEDAAEALMKKLGL